MKKLLIGLLTIILLLYLGTIATGNKFLLTAMARTYLQGHVTANIDDHRAFDTHTISASATQPWPIATDFSKVGLPANFLTDLEENSAVAFLVAHKGELLAEHYMQGYGPDSKTNSFSMAKTIVTLLVGAAIEDGAISGWDQNITTLIPEFAADPLGKTASIGSFSTMTSGYDWDEHYYSPMSPTVELYYTDDVTSFVLGGAFSREPESLHYYSSASTQILSIALLRALQESGAADTLSEYLSWKFWKPLGMNADGQWHTDNRGMELGYCCVNTNARNFAKLGQLLLQKGQWKGEQLLPESFIRQITQPVIKPNYGYSTWLSYDKDPKFFAFRGHLGQYIVIAPDHDLVIVRLGTGTTSDDDPGKDATLRSYVEQAIELIAQRPPD
ncbi:MAG: serine hydrolase [Pseudomonadota bacterium]